MIHLVKFPAVNSGRFRLVLGALALCIHVAPGFGANIYVGPTRAYTTIQAAVNAAAPGDTVTVDPGNYPETVIVNQTLDLEESTIRGFTGASFVVNAGIFRLRADTTPGSSLTINAGATATGEGSVDTLLIRPGGILTGSAIEGASVQAYRGATLNTNSRFDAVVNSYIIPIITVNSVTTLFACGVADLTGHPTLTVSLAPNSQRPFTGVPLNIIDRAVCPQQPPVPGSVPGPLAVNGTFAGLPDGATITGSGVAFRINYYPDHVTLTPLAPAVPALSQTGFWLLASALGALGAALADRAVRTAG